jgi:DNA repair protein RecO (recombination protein O)
MSVEKSLALVLRVVDFSESSAVVTLFTRDFGKVRALAKGARRPKGPFESALDLLCLCRIVFLRKSSDALDLLTEAKLERRFRPRSGDLASLYAAYYVAELLNELTDDYDTHHELFDCASRTLVQLSQDEDVARTLLRFEMTTLRLLGHAPMLDQCTECGRELPAAPRVRFGQLAGGVLCDACRSGHKKVAVVSMATIRALRDLGAPEESAWREVAIDRRTRGELRGVVNDYLANLLGRQPRMHRYLGMLTGR